MENLTKAIGAVVLIVFLVVASPLMSIWALNTLFAVGIPYTFWTWVAMLWLGASITGIKKSS